MRKKERQKESKEEGRKERRKDRSKERRKDFYQTKNFLPCHNWDMLLSHLQETSGIKTWTCSSLSQNLCSFSSQTHSKTTTGHQVKSFFSPRLFTQKWAVCEGRHNIIMVAETWISASQTHYTQNPLAPSQVGHWSAFGLVCGLNPRIML